MADTPNTFIRPDKKPLLPIEEERYLFNLIRDKEYNAVDLDKNSAEEVGCALKETKEYLEGNTFVSYYLDLRKDIDKDMCPIFYQHVLDFFGDYSRFFTGETELSKEMIEEVRENTGDKTKDKVDFRVQFMYDKCNQPFEQEQNNVLINFYDTYYQEASEWEGFFCSAEFGKNMYELAEEMQRLCSDREFDSRLQHLLMVQEDIER